jgi:hypothetical protein
MADLWAEQRIKLDALEHVLKETNLPFMSFTFSTIENLRAQKSSGPQPSASQTLASPPVESCVLGNQGR